MSLDNFIPEVWFSSTLERLNPNLVATQLVTREYQSAVTEYGSSVKINSFARPTIGDYAKNGAAITREKLNGSQISLVIDQAKDFNFDIDDIDKAQQTPKIMNEAMGEAALGFAQSADEYVFSLHTGVDAANIIGTTASPITITATNVYEQFTKAYRLLNEANVPKAGRWAAIPPFILEFLQNSDQFTRATSLGDDVVKTGQIGTIAGFRVFETNNLDVDTGVTKVMFGYPRAIAMADQLKNVEGYRPPDTHADAVKGLYVFGAKLIQPKGIVVLSAKA